MKIGSFENGPSIEKLAVDSHRKRKVDRDIGWQGIATTTTARRGSCKHADMTIRLMCNRTAISFR